MFDRDFDRRFRQRQRRFDIIFRIVATIIALTFIGIVAFWIFVGTVAFKAVDEIDQKGVHGVVQQIWCGKENPNCLQQK